MPSPLDSTSSVEGTSGIACECVGGRTLDGLQNDGAVVNFALAKKNSTSTKEHRQSLIRFYEAVSVEFTTSARKTYEVAH